MTEEKPALGRPATMQSGSYKSALERIADLEKALSEVAEELDRLADAVKYPNCQDVSFDIPKLAKQIRKTLGEKVE